MCHMRPLMRVRVVNSTFMAIVLSWPVPLVAHQRAVLPLLSGGHGFEGVLLGMRYAPGMITMWGWKWSP